MKLETYEMTFQNVDVKSSQMELHLDPGRHRIRKGLLSQMALPLRSVTNIATLKRIPN